jgi:hypothetical protein
MSSPARGFRPRPVGVRNLQIDVCNGQANIVEILDLGNGASQIRRLREQNFTQAERMEADRLKRQIVYGENGGAYDLAGLYGSQAESTALELTQLVELLERLDGTQAWDRRRHPR